MALATLCKDGAKNAANLFTAVTATPNATSLCGKNQPANTVPNANNRWSSRPKESSNAVIKNVLLKKNRSKLRNPRLKKIKKNKKTSRNYSRCFFRSRRSMDRTLASEAGNARSIRTESTGHLNQPPQFS